MSSTQQVVDTMLLVSVLALFLSIVQAVGIPDPWGVLLAIPFTVLVVNLWKRYQFWEG